MKWTLLAVIFLGVGNLLNAQVTNGTVMGKVFDKDSVTPIPFAKVYIELESGKQGVITDAEGRYKIEAIKPGVYTVGATCIGHGEMKIGSVDIRPDGITSLNIVMTNDNMLEPITIIYTPPLIEHDIVKVKIYTEDIEHSPYIRDPKALLAGTASDIQMPEGTNQIIIRGSRPGDAVYYIDGVKATDMMSIPGVAIGSMEAYTGGIPAKYGDTNGGVVILESKSYFDLYNAWVAGQ